MGHCGQTATKLQSVEYSEGTVSDCKVSPSGIEYSGVLSQTSTGNTCQRWDSQSPHPHNMTDPNRFPDANLGGTSNYCRNPDGKGSGPWCFTTNSGVEWEYCNILDCSGTHDNKKVFISPENHNQDYQKTLS